MDKQMTGYTENVFCQNISVTEKNNCVYTNNVILSAEAKILKTRPCCTDSL